MGVFFLSYNSCSFEDFAGSSCRLKLYGDLILLLFLLHSSLMLLHACWITSVTIFHHAFQILHIYYVKCVYELQDIGGDLHDYTLQVCIASKANSSLCTSSWRVFYILQSNSSISVFTLHMYIPVWKLNLYCHQSPKRGRLKVHLVPLSDFGVLKTYRLRDYCVCKSTHVL